jgi:hypothetical protein
MTLTKAGSSRGREARTLAEALGDVHAADEVTRLPLRGRAVIVEALADLLLTMLDSEKNER